MLFVGETNRDASAVSEMLLNHYAKEAERSGAASVAASSAGIWAEEGRGPSERASAFLLSKAVDTTQFISRKFSERMCDEHQLTLAMNMAIKGMLLFKKPEAVIYTLSEYALMGADISAMGRLGDAEYSAAMEELDEMIRRSHKRATRNVTF